MIIIPPFHNSKSYCDPSKGQPGDFDLPPVQLIDFGGAGGVAYVDPSLKKAMPYFGTMIDNLTATLGYQIGVDLHGAGYDWRLGPIGHTQSTAPGGYYAKLANLIETTVNRNQARAHLVTHSLGGPTTLAFLQLQGEDWVEKNIASFIPLSAPWIGGASMAKTECRGDNLGEPIPHDYLMPVQREAESGVFIMPAGSEGWTSDPMVMTPSKNYTVDDLPAMFQDLNLTQTFQLYNRLKDAKLLASQLNPPSCPTHVMYSTGVKTGRVFVYDKDFSAKNNDLKVKTTINGDGDGTVNIESLVWAEKAWTEKSDVTFFHVENVEHIGTVSNPEILGKIIEIVSDDNQFV